MIVKMKKISVICLLDDKEKTLENLREIGALHVEALNKTETQDRTEAEHLVSNIGKVIGVLASRKNEIKSDEFSQLSGEEIYRHALEAIDKDSSLKNLLENLLRDKEKMLPWGDFSQDLILKLNTNGIHVLLCAGPEKDLDNLPEGASGKIINREKNKIYYAVISSQPLDKSQFPVVFLPENTTLSKIIAGIDSCRVKLEENNHLLDKLKAQLPALEKYNGEESGKLEFLTNRDCMEQNGELTYINGYVPFDAVEKLTEASKEHGWALQYEDADLDDPQVPTLLKIPKVFRIIEPMLGFLGISPGYNEVDVSVCFLFFLTIFFGMIFGDGGYGFLLVVLSLILRTKYSSPQFRRFFNLLLTFGLSTFIWGALTGNFFGIDSPKRPEIMKGIDFFAKPEIKDRNIQLFCFILAIMHLTTGRLWRAILSWNAPRKVLAEIGWAIVLWGNFFVTLKLLVFPGKIETFILVLYGVGFALVAVCGVNWFDAGEVFNSFFGAIGTFVDILSYIRLYAVGMAGFYIANTFNGMGCSVMSLSDSPLWVPILIIGGILVILAGHFLNIILCSLGILVHGVRLNTLEFSNHIGLRWAGMEYKPFAKKEE